MTKWLASVQSLDEAQTLLPVLPDILDIKKPSEGALGALNTISVTSIVDFIANRCLISATIGDLPMQATIINSAMQAMVASGVDYIKVGLFPDQNLTDCLAEMATTINQLPVPVIAVLFADKMPTQHVVPQLKQYGFKGVMIDTAIKDGRHLLAHWGITELCEFIDEVKQQNMLCGLAGALRCEDVAELQFLGADYLGFRSALCQNHERTARIQITLATQIQQAILNIEDLKTSVRLLQKS
jgi:uncharacterized protein (UPF0264 family)